MKPDQFDLRRFLVEKARQYQEECRLNPRQDRVPQLVQHFGDHSWLALRADSPPELVADAVLNGLRAAGRLNDLLQRLAEASPSDLQELSFDQLVLDYGPM